MLSGQLQCTSKEPSKSFVALNFFQGFFQKFLKQISKNQNFEYEVAWIIAMRIEEA
jgi:hypothetical protein